MALATKRSEVALAVKALIDSQRSELGLKSVRYGRVSLEPQYPMCFVEAGPLRRDIRTTHQFGLDFTVYITVIVGKVQAAEQNVEDAEELVESVQAVLDGDRRLGGLVFFSYIAGVDPGFVPTAKVVHRGVRITWIGESREVF